MPRRQSPFLPSSTPEMPRLMKQCPICNEEYKAETTEVIEDEEGTQLVHLTCGSCKNSVLALMVTSQFGVSSIGMLTDLCPEDVERLRERAPICEEDILLTHQYLHSHEQDFIHSLMK